MLILKIMATPTIDGETSPDSDPNRDFTLIMVPEHERLVFKRDLAYEDKHRTVAIIGRYAGNDNDVSEPPDTDTKVIPLTGNAYVLNAQGKTIATRRY